MLVGGLPARTYQREFVERTGGGLHGPVREYAMRAQDVIVQTPEAYYVLEYRATARLFDKHYHAFERAKQTFRLLKAGPVPPHQ